MDNELSAKEKAERELKDKCFSVGMSEHDIELCILYFIRRLSHAEISDMEKYKMTIETSRNKKSKLKKMIF